MISNRITPFQFTLPRRERPHGSGLIQVSVQISIHAPAKGATNPEPVAHPGGFISIHAPAKGATTFQQRRYHPIQFQFTLPRRERHLQMAPFGRSFQFQFTLPRRERPNGTLINLSPPVFQFTLPRRERLPLPPRWDKFSHFNSRSREGSDFTVHNIFRFHDRISIHAPAKGATDSGRTTVLRYSISIHAPAKGATLHNRSGSRIPKISIHAPAKGATCFIGSNVSFASNFNSRSREGSDRGRLSGPRPTPYFNSRSREGSDHIQAGY